ncbi:MAG TPA: cyclic nucleotide-binding domain-containing protein, partial [Pyrinomonadaceae bacterium]|nr:cyclic nucleotide-binding domain-containing protein [Pyrinomonadaceae bacterium]
MNVGASIATPFGNRGSMSRVDQRQFGDVDRQSRTGRVQIFSGLSHEELSHIALRARGVRQARGEFIYMPGDRADFVYVLRQGRVKLTVLSETGKEIAIDIIQP